MATDASDLHAALDELARLKSGHAELTKRQCALEEQLGRAKSALIAARSARREARSAHALGEGSAEAAQLADKRVLELEAEIDALEPALETLLQRVTASAIPLRIAKQTAHDIAAVHAATMAAAQLEIVRERATAFAVALHRWYDLDSTARGTRLTGVRLGEAHGVVPLLERYEVWLFEREITIGNSNRPEALLTPSQILDALTPKKGVAAQQILARSESQAVDS